MNSTRICKPLLLLAFAGAFAAPALAAGAAVKSTTQAGQTSQSSRFQQELAACKNGQTKQEQSACVREAYAAAGEAKRGVLGAGATPDPANKTERCDALPGDQRTACMARMNGAGTVSGTPADGGVIRELTTVEVGKPVILVPVPAPEPRK